jgi:lamin tail-like protein
MGFFILITLPEQMIKCSINLIHKPMKNFNIGILCMLTAALTGSAYGQKVFFGNLHSHTSYSDGSETPEKAYAHARDIAGIDFLAITEHNHKQAGRIAEVPELYNGNNSASLISTANRFTVDNQFIAIYGQEFSTISAGNHANVLEVNQVISTDDVPNGRWDKLLNEWLVSHKDSENKDAIMVLNHPSISSCPNEVEYGIDDFNGNFNAWRDAISKHATLINIINGPSHDSDSPGAPSESEFKRYLSMGLHVAPTADQDNHRTNWGDAADTRTGVIAASLTKSNILNALRERNVYASQDKNLQVIAKVNNHLMGKIFRGTEVPSKNSVLDFSLLIKDTDEPNAQYDIEVFSGIIGGTEADIIKRIPEKTEGTITITGITYTDDNQYFFLRIQQTNLDGEERNLVWTSPVWFEPGTSGGSIPSSVVVTLAVDEIAEKAVITNLGSQTVDLKGWVLVSVKGDQRFTFTKSTKVLPNKNFTVLSGEGSKSAGTWVPSLTSVWSNSGDPGQLFDPNGNLIAEDGND